MTLSYQIWRKDDDLNTDRTKTKMVYDNMRLPGIIVIDYCGIGYPSFDHRIEVEYIFAKYCTHFYKYKSWDDIPHFVRYN